MRLDHEAEHRGDRDVGMADAVAEPMLADTACAVGPQRGICAPIHNRMPAIIAPTDFDAWLSISPRSEELLRPFPAGSIEAYPVSRAVGSVKNEGLDLLAPIPA